MRANQRIMELAGLRGVHAAFQWLHLQEQRLLAWQMEMLRIPAPPYKEEQRATWVRERFVELGLEQVQIDAEGNVLGELPGEARNGPVTMLSAHLDTIFPDEVLPEPRLEEGRVYAAGAADNVAGLTGLLAVAAAIKTAQLVPGHTILFAANVGEEAEGNLRGMRHLFFRSEYAGRIRSAICLEGAGTENVVVGAIGSRRLQATVTGPGGHSWTEAGAPNPIVVLSKAIAAMERIKLPRQPRTTWNVGRIEGGMSVTSVPERASCLIDLRSVDMDQLISLEVQVHRALEDAVLEANDGAGDRKLSLQVTTIGDRPAGALSKEAALLETVNAVDRHLRLRTELRIGSTDANVPLALGREAIAVGAGGIAGGIHTHGEWFDPAGRELALRRVLLILLDAAR